MKICCICSPGGHYEEMLQIIDAFDGHEFFFVTSYDGSFQRVSSIKTYSVTLISYAPRMIRILSSILKSLPFYMKVFILENPDLLISTGAEFAIPGCYLAKMLGKKIIFLESLARVYELSGAGRVIYPIADLFLVQWKTLPQKYSKANYWGRVI